MSSKARCPVTPAVRFLRVRGIAFTPRFYAYEERGGTRRASELLELPEHMFVKTLIMETDSGEPFVVLMHGDKQVSAKELARVIGVKRVAPCAPETANRHSGYQVGGTTVFATRRAMPVYAEASIFDLERICINGGKRGFMVEIDPRDLLEHLEVTQVSVATVKQR